MFRAVEQTKPELLSIPGLQSYFTYPIMISYFFMIICIPITQPQMSTRFFIPRSLQSMRFMMMAPPIYAFRLLIPAMILALGAAGIFPSLVSGDMVLGQVFSTHTGACFGGLVICGVVAAAMSTVSGLLLVLGSLVAKDLCLNLRRDWQPSATGRVWVGRMAVLLASAIAILLSIRPPQLNVEFSIASFAGTMQLAPAFIGGLYWRRATRFGALGSMVVGTVIFSITNRVLDPQLRAGLHPGFLGLLAGSATLVIGSLMTTVTPVEEQKRAEAMVAIT